VDALVERLGRECGIWYLLCLHRKGVGTISDERRLSGTWRTPFGTRRKSR